MTSVIEAGLGEHLGIGTFVVHVQFVEAQTRPPPWGGFCCLVLLNLGISQPALADLQVFACEPEWATLAQQLGGEHVSVYPATTALQDPHRIEARPSLIAQARIADLIVCSGAELEIGWLPLLLRQSGNSGIRATAAYNVADPVTSRPPPRFSAWRFRKGWIAAWATSILRAIRTCTWTRVAC